MPTTEPILATHLHRRGAALGLPIGGNFELTARCNFSCPMCYVHLSPEDVAARGKELTAQQWISLAEQARDRGLMFALLTGGEPLVREDFFEIYGAMKAMGLMVSINSNGSTLQGKNLERLLEDPPFRINISLYGGCQETYRAMCGNDAFDRVVDNIRVLKERGVDVRLNVSITPYNQQDMVEIHRIARELDLVVKASAYMYPPVRVHDDRSHRLDPQAAAKCTVAWDQLYYPADVFEQRAKNMIDLVPTQERECSVDPDMGVSCRAGSSSFWLTWDGRMLPCGMMPGPETYPLEVGFDSAWEELRQRTRSIRMPAKCTGCKYNQVCSVCVAVCAAETGDYEGVPQYVCEMTEAIVNETRNIYENSKN